MGKKPVAQPWGCHDLHTVYGGIHGLVYSTQTGIRLNQGHYIKGSHLLSKHAFIEIDICEYHKGT